MAKSVIIYHQNISTHTNTLQTLRNSKAQNDSQGKDVSLHTVISVPRWIPKVRWSKPLSINCFSLFLTLFPPWLS